MRRCRYPSCFISRRRRVRRMEGIKTREAYQQLMQRIRTEPIGDRDLKQHIQYYEWLYDRLEDEHSKQYLQQLVEARLRSDSEDVDSTGNAVSGLIKEKNRIMDGSESVSFVLNEHSHELWEVPKLIDSLNQSYLMYLTEKEGEAVLCALPTQKRQKRESRQINTAVTIAPHDRPWTNVELVKDCGLIPYMLYRKYGIRVTMVGASGRPQDYPYKRFVQGMAFEELPEYTHEAKVQYVAEHAQEIDLLLLRGAHGANILMAREYKARNPDGLIYCGLDANSLWMDRLPWYEPLFLEFLDHCDVLATSCTATAELLRRKWHRPISVITNGYYNFSGARRRLRSFQEKENIILTVGRLGTRQKATEVLLQAYAKIAEEIPNWKLRLVGAVDERLYPLINALYERYPGLRERITFTGAMEDREELTEEYERAKVFALPSRVEGGAPNVIAEALTGGCATAVTKIDAWEDCIDEGRCGAAAEIDDIDGFATCLCTLCVSERLEELCERARIYADNFYNMQRNVDELYKMLIEGEG